jgi:Flp pilus assembly protein TadB
MPIGLLVYGSIAVAGAGAAWYVMDLRATNTELRSEIADHVEAAKLTKKSLQAAADAGAKVLQDAAALRAQAERENRQAAGQIERLAALLNDSAPTTCEAAVRATQAMMP